jgi:dipeptidyl aminopeptidase/acylaminoacyl peptidase
MGDPLAGADFNKDGKAVLYASDQDSEFKRLHHHELATGRVRVVTAGFRGDVSGANQSHDGRRAVFFVSEDGSPSFDEKTCLNRFLRWFPQRIPSSLAFDGVSS